MKSFGELLRNFRRIRNLTQQEIADRLGLSSPYIAQIESGFKPPPPQNIVEKIGRLLHLGIEENRHFGAAAETERELQSLVKATRKVGYVLAGNKVCVPQKAISYRTQQEVDELIDSIPVGIKFNINTNLGDRSHSPSGSSSQSLQTLDDLRSWALSDLGDQPSVWLSFLGILYDVLLLTPDERLLCRQPSSKRQEIYKHRKNVGIFFQHFQTTILEAHKHAEDQKLPEVIAPHVAWKDIDQLLGSEDGSAVEKIPARQSENGMIRNIPIVSEVKQGKEDLDDVTDLGFIGLPQEWFDTDSQYEACFIQTDAYASLGLWPGCKTIYEVDASVNNEDLVLVRIGNSRCFRKYFDLGEQIFLQGGPLARPIQISKKESSIQVIGVVREMISRFRDFR